MPTSFPVPLPEDTSQVSPVPFLRGCKTQKAVCSEPCNQLKKRYELDLTSKGSTLTPPPEKQRNNEKASFRLPTQWRGSASAKLNACENAAFAEEHQFDFLDD